MSGAVRILQVVTIMDRGGIETMLMNYYRNIDRTKIQFDFLVHRQNRGHYDNEIEALGGKIFRLPAIQPKNLVKYYQQLTDFFRQTKYNVVHAHIDTLSTLALSAAKKKGIPIRIAHSHNTSMEFNIKAIFRQCSKMLLNTKCTHRFACGKKAGAWLFGKKFQNNGVLMNNAIDTYKFSFAENTRQFYRDRFRLKDRYVIGHVGRFSKQKNHKFMIDIFDKVQKLYDKSVLVLVGQGELEPEIKQLVTDLGLNDKVLFLGLRDDIHSLMQVFDVFLFPSLFEGLPVTLVEAQAAGLQCIVSDTVAFEAKITNLVEFISLTQAPGYWAKNILRFKDGYDRKDMYNEIAAAGYDIKKNANWLQTFYSEINSEGMKLRNEPSIICTDPNI